MNKVLTIKNAHLGVQSQPTAIFKILTGSTPFAQSQAKLRFFKILNEKRAELEKMRMELCNEYATKDDKDKPVMENNNFTFTAENKAKFFEEFNKLFNADCTIDVLSTLEKDLITIKQIINNSQVDVTLDETVQLEEIIEAIDSVTKLPKGLKKK